MKTALWFWRLVRIVALCAPMFVMATCRAEFSENSATGDPFRAPPQTTAD